MHMIFPLLEAAPLLTDTGVRLRLRVASSYCVTENPKPQTLHPLQGYRGNMEDGHIAVQSVTIGGEKCSLFAVFDGHGGVCAADFLVIISPHPPCRAPSHKLDSLPDAP